MEKIKKAINKIKSNRTHSIIATVLICALVIIIFASALNTIGDIKNVSNGIKNPGVGTDSIESEGSIGFIGSTSDITDSSTSKNESYNNGDYKNESTSVPEESNKEDNKQTVDEYGDTIIVDEKLVYTCDIDIETKNYKKAYNSIKELINEYKGITEKENTNNRDYDWYYSDEEDDGLVQTYIRCRIPSNKYNEFLDKLDKLGDDNKVVSKSTSTDNITQQYVDSKAELESLKIQEESLVNMLKSANTISDMITVEDRLTDVRARIYKLTADIRNMDMDVAYSYVNIELNEVKEYTKEEELGFFANIWDKLKDSLETSIDIIKNIITFIIVMTPIVILNVLPLVIIIRLLLKLRKKRLNKRAKKIEDKDNK